MPAHNDMFPWMSHYENYNFFEDRMRSHSKVNTIKNIGEGLYELDIRDRNTLKLFICECYSFGVAEYHECVENLGPIQAIIINSIWCDYTMEVKRYCREHKVGIFNIGDFMAAINREKFWEYLTDREIEYFKKNGWF